MKLSIPSEHLKSAILKIMGVVDKKNSRPILTNYYIFTKDQKLYMEATDLQVSARVLIDATVIEDGEFCLSAKNFYEIVKELPDSLVNLEIEKGQNTLKLQCEDIHYVLLVVSSEEFPKLHFDRFLSTFKFHAKNILQIISKTTHAISADETRQNLNGIFIHEFDSNLRTVATDGHVLAMVEDHDYTAENDLLKVGIIVPKKGVIELKKIADSYPDEQLEMAVDDSSLYVCAGESFWLAIRLIARDYPKYQSVIPQKTEYSLSVNKNSLLTAVKRIKILANEKSHAIKFSLSKNQLVISANHPSFGNANEKINVAYEGKDFDIGFNANYLIDTFNVVDREDVVVSFNNEFSPVIIKSNDSKEFLGVVMPLKL